MKMQRLIYYGMKAIQKYNMIENGDKIAIGLSGGKDSLSLMIMLANIKKYMNYDIDLVGIVIDCFGDVEYSKLSQKCAELEIELIIVRTQIAEIIFDERKEKNPCSLCSKMRKAALFDEAIKQGCNKVALGHNQDDLIETFFMSLYEEGRIHTFENIKKLDKKDISIIRPLIYAPEKEIIGFVNKYDLNEYIIKNKCNADGNTRREEMKNMLKFLRKRYNHIDDKIIGAIEKAQIDGYKE